MKVFVYYNLHRHCFSVRAMEGPNRGRVIDHTNEIVLDGAEFRVSAAGQARVRRERRKNVHAGVVGRISEGFVGSRAVTYNPYLFDTFVYKDTHEPIRVADRVRLTHRQIYV